jgi:hypothetical protein
MRQDRFLIGILAGIGLLVVVAIGLFFIRRGTLAYGPETTPDGVVRNYVVALKTGDYDRAYTYLGSFSTKPEKLLFRQMFLSSLASQIASTGIELGSASIDGSKAVVQITLLQGGGELFGTVYRNVQTVELSLEGGTWKITNMPYPFWDYGWVAPAKETVPAQPAP